MTIDWTKRPQGRTDALAVDTAHERLLGFFQSFKDPIVRKNYVADEPAQRKLHRVIEPLILTLRDAGQLSVPQEAAEVDALKSIDVDWGYLQSIVHALEATGLATVSAETGKG